MAVRLGILVCVSLGVVAGCGSGDDEAAPSASTDTIAVLIGDTATWTVASENLPSPDASNFTAIVNRLGCNGGVTGKVLEPTVAAGDGEIVVEFTVEPVDGPQACPGNNGVPVTVELPEPIGTRTLVDGACLSSEAVSTSFCVDGATRWPIIEPIVPQENDVAALEGHAANAGPVDGETSEDWALQPINIIANIAEFAVVGVVDRVDRVPSGDWGWGFLRVTLNVERDLFDSQFAGTKLEYKMTDALSGSAGVGGLPPDVAVDDRYGPQPSVGDEILILLGETTYAGPDGPEPAYVAGSGYMGVWTLVDSLAVSVDPLRTVDGDALIDRLVAERANGRITDDEAAAERDALTVRNPLGLDVDPPPSPNTTTAPRFGESGPLPRIIDDDAATLTLALPGPYSRYGIRSGPTDTGGYQIELLDNGTTIAAAGGPNAEPDSNLSAAAVLEDAVLLGGIGQTQLSTDNISIAASTDDRDSQVLASAVGPSSNPTVPVVLVLVPIGTTEVTVADLTGETAIVWTLPANPSEVLGAPQTLPSTVKV